MADLMLSGPALCALGCLAAFDHTGLHNPSHLRRHTRLTKAGLEASIHELVANGLAHLEGNGRLWLTYRGEAASRRLFEAIDGEAASEA